MRTVPPDGRRLVEALDVVEELVEVDSVECRVGTLGRDRGERTAASTSAACRAASKLRRGCPRSAKTNMPAIPDWSPSAMSSVLGV